MSVQIEVTDLHKTYGKNEVLKGISAKFNKGDVVCIIGPSGSGKSTFLRTLNGLEDATSGDVIINGYNLIDITFLKGMKTTVPPLSGLLLPHPNPFS